MRFDLSLHIVDDTHVPLLPCNYQYPLSSAIYRIIQRADKEFAAFLHDKGYGDGKKQFKLFTFSDIRTPFKIKGDRMLLQGKTATLTICFHMPEAAQNFIKGLFIHQHLEIADKHSKVSFFIEQVEIAPPQLQSTDPGSLHIVLLSPLSPIVVGRKNERGNYDYLSPGDQDFTTWLLYSWIEKYKTVYDLSEEKLQKLLKTRIEVQFLRYPPQQRLIAVKQGTTAETRIRGYTKFHLKVIAALDFLELGLNAGLGLYNAQGTGAVQVIQQQAIS